MLPSLDFLGSHVARARCVRSAVVVASLLCGGLLYLPVGVAAEPERPGRYTMMPAEGGFIRLDTATGLTSLCTRKDGAWVCEPMADSQTSMRDELARLEAENKRLKDELRQMEETFGLSTPSPDGGTPNADAGPPAPKSRVPTEQDVDRLFDYIEGMVRKFRERIERMEKEHGAPPSEDRKEAPAGKDTPL